MPEPRDELVFGFACLEAAYRAKSGKHDRHDGRRLVAKAMRHMEGDEGALAAAEDFAAALPCDPVRAARGLDAYVYALATEMCAGDAAQMAGPVAEAEHDWQRRADVNG